MTVFPPVIGSPQEPEKPRTPLRGFSIREDLDETNVHPIRLPGRPGDSPPLRRVISIMRQIDKMGSIRLHAAESASSLRDARCRETECNLGPSSGRKYGEDRPRVT